MCVLSECLKPSTSMKNFICSPVSPLLSTTWLILVGRERSRPTFGCCAPSEETLIVKPSGLWKRKP